MLKNFNKFRTLLFLLIHPVFLVLVFFLGFFGIITEYLAFLLMGALSLEAIYIASFMGVKLRRTVGNLKTIEEEMTAIKEDTTSFLRMQRELIYAGHQIKTLRTELDAIKKGNGIKLSGHGHSNGHTHTHRPVVAS